MTGPTDSAPEEATGGLLRVLGPGYATAMVVGSVIGTGIFAKPAEIAAASGDFSLILWAWIAGGITCILGGLCFAELAVMLPRAGGLYVYLREAYGQAVAFVFAWSEYVFGRPASIAVYSMILFSGVEHLAGLWRGQPIDFGLWPAIGFSSCVIATIAGVNLMGVIWGGRFQGFATLVKCLVLVVLGALPFVLPTMGYAGVDRANYATTIEPMFTTLSGQFAAVLLSVMWAYNGWHAICPIAEEVKQPRRNIPVALFAGLGIIIVLYLGMNVAYHGTMTMAEIKDASFQLPQIMTAKLLDPISPHFAHLAGIVISISIVVGMLGGINVNLMNGPRVAFAAGRDDPALRVFSRVNPEHHTPTVSILFQAGMSIALMSAVALYLHWNNVDKYANVFFLLTAYVVFSASIFYFLTVAAVMVLRWTRPDLERSYRTPGYPVVPVLYLLVNVWFLYQVYLGSWKKGGGTFWHEANVSILLSLAGLPVMWICHALFGKRGGWGANRRSIK